RRRREWPGVQSGADPPTPRENSWVSLGWAGAVGGGQAGAWWPSIGLTGSRLPRDADFRPWRQRRRRFLAADGDHRSGDQRHGRLLAQAQVLAEALVQVQLLFGELAQLRDFQRLRRRREGGEAELVNLHPPLLLDRAQLLKDGLNHLAHLAHRLAGLWPAPPPPAPPPPGFLLHPP